MIRGANIEGSKGNFTMDAWLHTSLLCLWVGVVILGWECGHMDIIYAHFYIPSYNYTILIWGHLVSGTLFTGFFAFPILIDYNEKGPPLQHSQFRMKRPGDRGGLSLTSLMSTKKDHKDNLVNCYHIRDQIPWDQGW